MNIKILNIVRHLNSMYISSGIDNMPAGSTYINSFQCLPVWPNVQQSVPSNEFCEGVSCTNCLLKSTNNVTCLKDKLIKLV